MLRIDLMYDCILICRRVGLIVEFFFLVMCGLINVNNSFFLLVFEVGFCKLKKIVIIIVNNKIIFWLCCYDGCRFLVIFIISFFY